MKNDMASQMYGTTMTQRDATADLIWLRRNTDSDAYTYTILDML